MTDKSVEWCEGERADRMCAATQGHDGECDFGESVPVATDTTGDPTYCLEDRLLEAQATIEELEVEGADNDLVIRDMQATIETLTKTMLAIRDQREVYADRAERYREALEEYPCHCKRVENGSFADTFVKCPRCAALAESEGTDD